MQSEAPQSSAYNFRFKDGTTNEYAFETAVGCIYLAYLKPSGYLFPQSSDFQQDVFEFVITLTNGPANALPLTVQVRCRTVVAEPTCCYIAAPPAG